MARGICGGFWGDGRDDDGDDFDDDDDDDDDDNDASIRFNGVGIFSYTLLFGGIYQEKKK